MNHRFSPVIAAFGVNSMAQATHTNTQTAHLLQTARKTPQTVSVAHTKTHHANSLLQARVHVCAFSFLFVSALLASSLFAQSTAAPTPKTATARLSIEHPTSAFPGDPVCVTVYLPQTTQTTQFSARARLKRDAGKIDTASESFYSLPHKNGAYVCLLPLDSTAKTGAYTLTVSGTLDGAAFEQTYRIDVEPKDFVSETLHLDAVNTAIKTDTSTARKTQINRLNDILFTVNPNARYMRAPFSPPVTSTRRTSFYGDRRIYAYSNGKSETSLHYGIDYGVPTGTPVRSCGRGRVVLVENRVTTGNSVVVEHLPGLYSLYYHMSTTAVREGDIVEQGALLGESGATGLATGPHLHWEIRLLGIAVNPDFFVQNTLF